MNRESKLGTIPLPSAKDIGLDFPSNLETWSSNSSSDSGIDAAGLDNESYSEDHEDQDSEDQEEEDYINDMNDLNAYYSKLVANGSIAFTDVAENDADVLPRYLLSRPTRTASQEEELEVEQAVLNDPEVLINTLRNTRPTASSVRSSTSEAAKKKAARHEAHVRFLNGSPRGENETAHHYSNEAASETQFDEEVHAWDMPVSPMDKAFRSRVGGPLGSSAPPPELAGSDDDDRSGSTGSEENSEEEDSSSASDSEDLPYANGDESGSSSESEDDSYAAEGGLDSEEEEEEGGDLMRFLQLERAIFAVISPYMTSSPSGKGASAPKAVVFSRELLRSISKAAVTFILPNSSGSLMERSSDGVYAVLRMFEGADVTDSYRLLMDLLKSVLEELITAEDNMDNNSSPPVVGYNKQGMPKDLSANKKQLPQQPAKPAATYENQQEETKPTDSDEIPDKWTHPLISDLLRQNPSLRAYVRSRTDAEALAAGFEQPTGTDPEELRKLYVLSSSTSSSEADSEESVVSSDHSDGEVGGQDADTEDDVDPLTKLIRTSITSTNVNTASPSNLRSPVRGQKVSDPLNDSTVEVGPVVASPYRSPARLHTNHSLSSPGRSTPPPRISPLRSVEKASVVASSFEGASYSDEEVLNEFQDRQARSPLMAKLSKASVVPEVVDLSTLSAVGLTTMSPKVKAEARRRRKHSNVIHDDSSSAGNASEEELRKELHKNAPYDDSSDDTEIEQRRRAEHNHLAYDDSTSCGNRTEEEERKRRHGNVPYDDSSNACGEISDDSVDSDGLLASAALTTAAKDWDVVNEEELIRRKYRADAYLAAVKTDASAAAAEEEGAKSLTEEDDDYDFASAVVKYWDQLLGVPEDELVEVEDNDDMLPTLTSMQSFATSAAVARPETPSESSEESVPRQQDTGKEASFEEFRLMSPEQRTEYLYGSIEKSIADHERDTAKEDKDLNMVQSDLHLWHEMETANKVSGTAEKSPTQRDYATLREEIFELSHLLGISPSEVLLNGGSAIGKRPLQQRPDSAPGSDKRALLGSSRSRISVQRAGSSNSSGKQQRNSQSVSSYNDEAAEELLAGFMSGMNTNTGPGATSSGIRTSIGTRLFESGIKAASSTAATETGKKKKKSKTVGKKKKTKSKAKSAASAGLSTPASKEKQRSTDAMKRPEKGVPSPSLLRPTHSFTKSAPKGDKSKRAKAMVRDSLSKAASNRGKRHEEAQTNPRPSSPAKNEFLAGRAPPGSVQFVSVQRRSLDSGVLQDFTANRYRPTSPDPFERSSRLGARPTDSSRPTSAPHRRMTRNVGKSLNDTDIVVMDNTPIYPRNYPIRPSSAPASRKQFPERTVSPTLRSARSASTRKSDPQVALRSSASAAAGIRASRRRSNSTRLSESLNAPTMASIARTNDILTRALEFMNAPRTRQPWDDNYRGSRSAWMGGGGSSARAQKKK